MQQFILSFLFLVTITLSAFGQSPEGFKYQAVVRDASSNPMTDKAVGMQLTIQQGAIGGTAVYTETFAPTTNAYGLVNLEIGTGTSTDDFSAIDWSNGPYFMKTAIDINGGTSYVTMGTSQLMSVPYALYAKEAGSGPGALEEITEGSNTGYRIVGRDTANYGDIGDNAVDLSYFPFASTTNGASGQSSTAVGYGTTASGIASTAMGHFTFASGDFSTAMGESTTASGDYSTAVGYGTTASGDFSTAMGESTNASGITSIVSGLGTTASGVASTAMGFQTTASGYSSTAMGFQTTASGDLSTAMGFQTTAPSSTEMVIGQFNTMYTPAGITTWNADDRLFVIGNGLTSSSRSDAMTVLKNGNVGVGSSNPEGQLFVKQTDANAGGSNGIFVDYNGDYWKTYHSGLHYSFSNEDTRYAYVEDNTGNYVITSDKNLKTNIQELPNVMEGVLRLNPVSYVYKSSSDPSINTLGFLAQEVGKVFPDVVRYAEDGTPGLAYDLFSILSIKAIQEQQVMIDEQQIHIAKQKEKIESLENEINSIKDILRDIQSK